MKSAFTRKIKRPPPAKVETLHELDARLSRYARRTRARVTRSVDVAVPLNITVLAGPRRRSS